jgi:hypothetical protein
MLFSVGDTGGLLGAVLDGAVVVVVVVVVLDGPPPPPPPHAAVRPAIAMIAAPPATAATRRPKRRDFMFQVLTRIPRLDSFGRRQALLILTATRPTVQKNTQSCRNSSQPTVFAGSELTATPHAAPPRFQQRVTRVHAAPGVPEPIPAYAVACDPLGRQPLVTRSGRWSASPGT